MSETYNGIPIHYIRELDAPKPHPWWVGLSGPKYYWINLPRYLTKAAYRKMQVRRTRKFMYAEMLKIGRWKP